MNLGSRLKLFVTFAVSAVGVSIINAQTFDNDRHFNPRRLQRLRFQHLL